jgi:hypothetical protein
VRVKGEVLTVGICRAATPLSHSTTPPPPRLPAVLHCALVPPPCAPAPPHPLIGCPQSIPPPNPTRRNENGRKFGKFPDASRGECEAGAGQEGGADRRGGSHLGVRPLTGRGSHPTARTCYLGFKVQFSVWSETQCNIATHDVIM